LSSSRSCLIEFENPESALAAKHDLKRNSEISVRVRHKKKKADPVKMKRKTQAKYLRRKIRNAEKYTERSDEVASMESSLYVSYRHQKLPLPDVIRKLHPKIIDVRIPSNKNSK
jgi:hypothetical protein